jgi:hypothetical protein
MTKLLASIRQYLSVRHRTVGAAALRIALGLNMLVLYVMHIPERNFIWGDRGVLSAAVARAMYLNSGRWSLFFLSDSPLFHAVLFWGGLVVTILFIVGVWPRLMSVLFFVMSYSLYARNPLLMDGGDNILILLAFFLMFVDTSGRFVPWQREETRGQNSFVALVHNFGVIAILAQLCILYFTSAWAKMSGHMWQDGTAIYYILRSTSFDVSPLNSIITQNATLETILTYATIVLQIGFPFVVWNRLLKWPWLIGAFTFHLGIGISMGLMWFSLVMLSCELIFIDDRSYAKARAWLVELAQKHDVRSRVRGVGKRASRVPRGVTS